jgi:hypothetical protein
VVEDEDAPAARPFLPVMDWTTDYDGGQANPDPFCHSERSEESALLVRPFSPTLAWDDWDWSRSVDTRVVVQDDMDSRSLQAIALQVIAMSMQQMLAAPMLGLQQLLDEMMLGVESIDNDV